MKLFSPAKINWHLSILDKREDGYHNLFMLMTKISLGDDLILEEIPNGIQLRNPLPNVPNEKNLLFRAADLVRKKTGVTRGVALQITKRIPMGGGLGGGSSNAASVLLGLNQLWDLKLSPESLIEMGKELGADVPFFLMPGACWIEGLGERGTPGVKLPELWMIILVPPTPVSTPWAYQQWDLRLTPKRGDVRERRSNRPKEFKGLAELLPWLHNDFESVVIPEFPLIGEAKKRLQKAGASGVLMSGSGASVFGVFENRKQREDALKDFSVPVGWKVLSAENNNG